MSIGSSSKSTGRPRNSAATSSRWRRYVRFWRSGAWRSEFPVFPELRITTTHRARVARLRRAAEDGVRGVVNLDSRAVSDALPDRGGLGARVPGRPPGTGVGTHVQSRRQPTQPVARDGARPRPSKGGPASDEPVMRGRGARCGCRLPARAGSDPRGPAAMSAALVFADLRPSYDCEESPCFCTCRTGCWPVCGRP